MAKADKALVQCRVNDLYRIILDGALWVDLCEYVREKEKEQGSAWFLPEDATPLSESQIRRYQQKANKLIEQSGAQSRKRLLKRHLAQRRHLYAKASLAGDVGAALRCLDSEAALLHLDETRVEPLIPGPGKDRKAHLAEAVAFYSAIVHSDARLPERMRAQERIDRLLGLEDTDLAARIEMLEAVLKQRSNKP